VLDIVRGDWERAHRQLEEQKQDPRRYRQLLGAVDAVTQALRTRVGQTYTLEQLARAYADVERWGRDAVEENAQYEGWARDLALVEDAAFHDYARGALDFEP
jgi:NADPH-dependent glutamate synthase beta subunit-like oxidoreductase